jgi:hypothetical protein
VNLASFARRASLARLDPVRLPIGRLIACGSDRCGVRPRIGRYLLCTLDDGVVWAHGLVAAERGLALGGLLRLAAVRAVRASLPRRVAALPIVAAAAPTAASAPATSATLPLAVLLLIASRLATLTMGLLRIALTLPLLPL